MLSFEWPCILRKLCIWVNILNYNENQRKTARKLWFWFMAVFPKNCSFGFGFKTGFPQLTSPTGRYYTFSRRSGFGNSSHCRLYSSSIVNIMLRSFNSTYLWATKSLLILTSSPHQSKVIYKTTPVIWNAMFTVNFIILVQLITLNSKGPG